MGASLGTGNKKSVNVDLNIVPFIDVMSCLTAFLLYAATWTQIAQLQIEPAGRATEAPVCMDGACDDPKLSVLLDGDDIWVGVSRVNDFTKIAGAGHGQDWARLEAVLKEQKASAFFANKTAIEIAANSTPSHPLSYQQLIATMDIAVKVGFIDVGVTEPRSLSAYPTM